MTTQADVDAIRKAVTDMRAGRKVTKISVNGRAMDFNVMTIEEAEDALTRAENELAGGRRRAAIKPYFG